MLTQRYNRYAYNKHTMSSFINKIVPTAQQVNLARRWTVQNENDLVQENLFEDDFMDISKQSHDHDTCRKMSEHLLHFKDMPVDCLQYSDVAFELKRRDSDTTHPSSMLS
ncbi:hypothetical protein MPSEU_000198400 [Mayamaea pseudoterrestris]|nr:hypothetical protein MPSEU_000198400 [Mayamaea pseudoterrestris]